MSFKERMEALDANITTLESAAPFTINQVFPPNQKDWEDAWITAGNDLPIPAYQELYWTDDIGLRGEYKTLPDQFAMLARSLSTGFQIRDIAGWEDDEHLLVFVVRDDPDAPQGACRLYMDGTLEELSLGGSFLPDGLLGYNIYSSMLYYYEGLIVKRIHTGTLVIQTVATCIAGGLPEWRFFVFANTDLAPFGAGDVLFGARRAGDVGRSLYYYFHSGPTLFKQVETFNPGTGDIRADRPIAFTNDYIFMSALDSRSAFDGNVIHQLEWPGIWELQVDIGTFSDEVRVTVVDTDYFSNAIEIMVSHTLGSVPYPDWNYTKWCYGAFPDFEEIYPGQPHNTLLQTLRQNVNDHDLDYHMQTRLWYDPAFVADGGSEAHYNNVGGILISPSRTKYLVHDLGWHTWTVNDAPDIWVVGDTTSKVYRVTDWQQYDDDFIIIATGTLDVTVSNPTTISLVDVHPDYGLIEVIFETYGAVAGQPVYPALYDLAGGHGENILSSNVDALTADEMQSTSYVLSELSTNASLIHQYIFRYLFETTQEITFLLRQSVRTAFGTYVNRFQESVGLTAVGALELPDFELAINSGTVTGNRYLVRAWRTQPRMKQSGSEYDPSMA